MEAQSQSSRTRPLAWLGAACVMLSVACRPAHAVANIGLLDAPLPFAVETHPLQLSPALFAAELPLANASVSFAPTDASQTTLGDIPFPTGAWWTNLVLDKGDNPVSTMPYMLKVDGGKLHAAYPFRVVMPTIIQNGFTSEIVLSAASSSSWQQQVVGFDAFGVALKFTSPGDGDAGDFTAHLVRGSPFLTLEYANAAPVIESKDGIKIQRLKRLVLTDMAGNVPRFAVYLMQNSNGHMWYLFASDPTLQLSLRESRIMADHKFTGVLRLALALTVDSLPILLESVPVYPLGAQVQYEVDVKRQIATLAFDWKTLTFPGYENSSELLLMLSLPHHNDSFVGSSVTLVDDLRYTAIRGVMVGVLGNRWEMEEELPEIEWNYPLNQGVFDTTENADKPKRQEMAKKTTELIEQTLKQDILTYPNLAVDSYGFGKQMGRETRLLLIADAFNQTDAFSHELDKIKRELKPWLSGTNADSLVYDERFGGLVTKNGLHDQNADFGNGYYNDHYFHYGYFMHGLAVLRKYAPEFLATHAPAAAMLVADIGTPLDSTPTKFFDNFPARHYFPTARHKDWFMGHSYASGLFQMQVGKSQESSSECINAYYGLALFGSLDQNAETDPLSYFNYARLMLALEMRSTKKYYHMRENSKVYEPIFARNAMVGVLGEMNAVYNTWFGDRPEYMHGINMIPFTPISSQLMSEAYVAREYDQIRSSYELLGAGDIWKSIIVMDHAILDGEAAWDELTHEVAAYDTWNSKSNALVWIATRPSWFSQKDRAILRKPNLHDSDKCFGYPECATAGANGTALACCDTLPGCCPSSLGCCPKKDVSKLPANACFGEQQCALLGVSCCNSIDGCCEPDPVTGTVLGCCKDQSVRPIPTTAAPAPEAAEDEGFCTSQSKCADAGLLCCDSEEGCCKPDPVTGGRLDCCVAPPSAVATCHSQPKCGALELLCCGTANGCCTPDPITGATLDCCETSTPAPTETVASNVSTDDSATCHHQPQCAAAGLDCCSTPQGCCQPDPVTGNTLLCCQSGNGSKAASEVTTKSTGDAPEETKGGCHGLLIAIGVVVVVGLSFAMATCYRRRHYAPIDQDMRAWYCGALMLVVAGFFVYLIATA